MPYIKDTNDLRDEIKSGFINPINAGELNFRITMIVDEYIRERGKSYNTLNEVIGVLECVKLELYRRIVAPYEDTKIAENGDVYTVV